MSEADSVAACVQMAYGFHADRCSECNKWLVYSSRSRGFGLCGECSRFATGTQTEADMVRYTVDVHGKLVSRPPGPTLDGLPVDVYNAKQKQAERPRCHVVRAEPPKTAGTVVIGYAGENLMRGDLVKIDKHGTICLACF